MISHRAAIGAARKIDGTHVESEVLRDRRRSRHAGARARARQRSQEPGVIDQPRKTTNLAGAYEVYSEGMPILLLILILILVFGGGGYYWGGPTYGGGGLGLILVICLVIYLMGGFRRKL